MRNNLIYKIVMVGFFVTTMNLSASLSSSSISNKISEIKEERSGISLMKLDGTLNPFLMNKKKVRETKGKKVDENLTMVQPIFVEEVFTLSAVLNRRAFINGKWYKQGDKISSYTVGYVSSSGVLLKSFDGNKQLKLKKKKKSFIKLNRGYR